MSDYTKVTKTDPEIFLRAMAISLVAFNHANPYAGYPIPLEGGMTFLFMLSGAYFAKIVLSRNSAREAGRAIVSFGSFILLPSLLMVVMFAVLFRHIDWQELLFVKNLFSADRIAKFPTWYPQVIAQILAAIYLFFLVPGAFEGLRTKAGVLIAFFVSLVMLVVTSPPSLPHLPLQHLWNFTLGWTIYIFALRPSSTLVDRLMAAAAALVAALVAYGPASTAFFTLVLGSLTLTFVRKLPLPASLAYLCRLLSRATFTIFLWHRFFFEVYEDIFSLRTPQGGVPMFLFGMTGSIALWIAWSAAKKTWKALRRRSFASSAGRSYALSNV